jgi:hypothetical protein
LTGSRGRGSADRAPRAAGVDFVEVHDLVHAEKIVCAFVTLRDGTA